MMLFDINTINKLIESLLELITALLSGFTETSLYLLLILIAILKIPFFKPILEKIIDHFFALGTKKSLEKYKSELKDLNSRFKYEIDKNLIDFKIYTSKKHWIYGDIYHQLREFKSYAFELTTTFKVIQELTFEEYSENDLIQHLTNKKFPESKQQELLTSFSQADTEEEKKNISQQIHAYYKTVVLPQISENLLNALKRNFYLKGLFFSEDLYQKLEEYIKKLSSLFYIGKYENQPYTTTVKQEKIDLEQYLSQALPNISSIMIRELSGDIL